MAKKIIEKKLPSAIPIYTVGIIWLICGLVFPLYKLSFFLITALLSVGAFFVATKIFPATIIKTEVDEPLILTGNAAADAVIANGQGYIERFHKANAAITDPDISQKIDKLESICLSIFAEIRKNPNKATQIRKFMNYFLPTTLKLLETYDNLSASGATGENSDQVKKDIESSMDNVVLAFAKQLDNLYSSEALDVSAEISVLEAVLAGEGLINNYSEQQKTIDKNTYPPSHQAENDKPEIKLHL